MIEILLDVFLILMGVSYLVYGYRMNKYKKLGRYSNKFIKVEKIKDKDRYIRFHSKWSCAGGIIQILLGVSFIIDEHFIPLDTIIIILCFTFLIAMRTFTYQSAGNIYRFEK